MTSPKAWPVTGASKGLGPMLVHQLPAAGYAVAATSRQPADLKRAVPDDIPRFLSLHRNLSDEAGVRQAVEMTGGTFDGTAWW